MVPIHINGVTVELQRGEDTGWYFALVDGQEYGPYLTDDEFSAGLHVAVALAKALRRLHGGSLQQSVA